MEKETDDCDDNVASLPASSPISYSQQCYEDEKISATYLEKMGLTFRNMGNSSGSWLIAVMPFALIFGADMCERQCSDVYEICLTASVGLSLLAIFDLICCLQYDGGTARGLSGPCICIGNRFLINPPSSLIRILGYVISYAVVYGRLAQLFPETMAYNLCCALYVLVSYRYLFLDIIRLCPRSFTYGEATVVCQSLVLFTIVFATNIFRICTTSASINSTRHPLYRSKVSFIMQCILAAVLSSIALTNKIAYLSPRRPPVLFLLNFCLCVLLFAVLTPWLSMRENIFLWTYRFVTADYRTLLLLACWIICSLFAVIGIMLQIRQRAKASTVVRKYFHALVVIVYLSGLSVNANFLYFASVVAFALMAFVETLRVVRMPFIGEYLQNGFAAYADDKDEGPIALTPFYLLIGCSAPLWLYPNDFRKPLPLPLLAGILTVGIGDTVASVVGTRFGTHKWSPESSKTIEGSVGAFLAQSICLIVFAISGQVNVRGILFPTIALAITTYVEAKTDQIDNLVLPLVAYPLMIFAHHLGAYAEIRLR